MRARRFPSPGALAVLASLVLLALARPVLALQSLCGNANRDWTTRCSARSGLQVRVLECPPGRIVVSLSRQKHALLVVEINAAGADSFRRVGKFGLSPVGEFRDWAKEPAERRSALDALQKCVSTDPSLDVGTGAHWGHTHSWPSAPLRPARPPWLAMVALLLGAAACALGFRRRAPTRRQWLTALALAGATAACFASRWLVLPRAFFHQNGHGPEWVLNALERLPGVSDYGPGFHELFGFATRLADTPEAGVFLEQALLAAFQPMAAWIIARRSGAATPIAGAIALGVAVDPTLARLAQSESYFAVGVSLSFIAAAFLAAGSYRARVGSPRFLLSVAAAGLLVSQGARVHPLIWFGTACLPLVVLVGPGRFRTRLSFTLVAGFGIAAVVVLTSGTTLLGVLRGPAGQQWNSPVGSALVPNLLGTLPEVLLLLVLWLFARGSWRRPAFAAFVCVLVLAAARTANPGYPNPATWSAHYRLFWPALTAPLAALLGRLARRKPRSRTLAWVAAGGVVACAVVYSAGHWKKLTELPTDAREQNWALAWRRQLPPGAVIAYLSRAEKRIVVLPFYRGLLFQARPHRLNAALPPPNLGGLGSDVYYYRSSVCSSKEGAGYCRRVEHTAKLEPIDSRDFPAIPSMKWDHYNHDPVRVELFHVKAEATQR